MVKNGKVIAVKTIGDKVEIIAGGHHFGVVDGAAITRDMLKAKEATGASIIYNPKPGSVLSQKYGL